MGKQERTMVGTIIAIAQTDARKARPPRVMIVVTEVDKEPTQAVTADERIPSQL